MYFKWFGAILIISSCGGTGFSIVSACRKEEKHLKELLMVLHSMEGELEYRLTPLPELIKHALYDTTGSLRCVMEALLRELNDQEEADVYQCMLKAMKKRTGLSTKMTSLLKQLGRTLGRFDLQAQLRSLHGLQAACEEELKRIRDNQDIRFRSYQTLGLCAGAALAILFI